MKLVPATKMLEGEFKILVTNPMGVPLHAYYVNLHKGLIVDCVHEVLQNYFNVHIKYLLTFLKRQGRVEVYQIIRETVNS